MSNSLLKIRVWSQSVVVARWVRPAIEHAQDVLSGGLGLEWSMLFSEASRFVFNLSCLFLTDFFLFGFGCFLFSKIKSFVLGSSFDFFYVFFSFVFRLESSLQKNNLSML